MTDPSMIVLLLILRKWYCVLPLSLDLQRCQRCFNGLKLSRPNMKGFKDEHKHVFQRCQVIISGEKLLWFTVFMVDSAGGLKMNGIMFQSCWPRVFSDFWIVPINDTDSQSIIGCRNLLD